MKLSYSQTRKVVKTGLILIIILILLYFFVLNKSTSKDEINTKIENTYPIMTRANSDIGFCFQTTRNGTLGPKQFLGEEMWNSVSFLKDADNGTSNNSVKYKWQYDDSNTLTIERTINIGNYTDAELSNLKTTNETNVYSVNKIVPIYDSNDPNLSLNVSMNITPFVLSRYSDCK